MDAGHVLKLSSEDGQLIVTLRGPKGGVLASGPVTLDEVALECADGPSQYGDALLAALLREPVGGVLRRAGVTRVRLALADDVRHLHLLRWECLLSGMRGPQLIAQDDAHSRGSILQERKQDRLCATPDSSRVPFCSLPFRGNVV